MIPIAELRSYVGLTSEDKDSLLLNMERNAIAFLQNQTGRYFGKPEEVTEIVTGTGTDALYLANAAIVDEDVPITIDEYSYIGGDATAIDGDAANGFALRGVRLLRKGGHWTNGLEYHVTYQRGYEPGQEPGDIRQLVMDLVALKYKSRGGVRSESISGYSYTLAEVADVPMMRETLASYRRIRV